MVQITRGIKLHRFPLLKVFKKICQPRIRNLSSQNNTFTTLTNVFFIKLTSGQHDPCYAFLAYFMKNNTF